MKFGIEIFIIEIIGIIAFTISGVIVAFKKRLDLLGVITLGTITAVGGGALRDILLGILPPSMFKNGIYVLFAFITAIASFYIGILAIKTIKRKRVKYYNLITFFALYSGFISEVAFTMIDALPAEGVTINTTSLPPLFSTVTPLGTELCSTSITAFLVVIGLPSEPTTTAQ